MIKGFYAVTSCCRIYKAWSTGPQEAVLTDVTDTPATVICSRIMVAVEATKVSAYLPHKYPSDHYKAERNYSSAGRERAFELVPHEWRVWESESLLGLFAFRNDAHACVSVPHLLQNPAYWTSHTQAVLAQIGPAHPSFYIRNHGSRPRL